MVGISSRTVNRSNKDRAQDRVQTWCIFFGCCCWTSRRCWATDGCRPPTPDNLWTLPVIGAIPRSGTLSYKRREWSIIGTESMASQKRRLWKHNQRQRSIILFLSSFHGIIGMCNIEASHQSLIRAQTSLQTISLHNCKNVISSEYFAV